ncbi:sensor histidine kinase [Chthonobacter rhizosphaerae]|uniref:sensor histidine kinase n=1 Tax=Chthonobacter rhizosphaerae TaxID=2735553 RepID=UPI0015EF1FAC|nr:HWE histidine kinase domain-containing protein [Chthonobacter rhizosphaerae]
MTNNESAHALRPAVADLDVSDFGDLVIENAADAIFVMDTEGRTVFANAAAERTFGWSREDLAGRSLHDMVHHHHPDGRPFPMSDCPLGQVFRSHTRLEKHEDVFFHRSGAMVHVACSNAPVVREGRMIGAVLIAVDISERKRAEDQQRLLLHELNHRVKNTLATVQSIVSQSLKSGLPLGETRAAIEERLIALGRAHDILIRERWEGADLGEVVVEAMRPFTAAGSTLVRASGPTLRLPPNKALSIAMALQELGTNATKYGALSTPDGTIDLTWSVSGDGDARRMRLVWRESGGPAVTVPASKGFGTRLLERSLAYDLDGTVTIAFDPSGVVCEVDAPLP